MLDSLGEIELAMNMLRQENSETALPVDHRYAQLKANIQVLPRDGAAFGLLQKYMSTTHVHKNTFGCHGPEIVDIFTVAREGEAQR